MLQIVLLAGKILFLIVLYLFIYRVVRSTTRELRAAGRAPERQEWPPPAVLATAPDAVTGVIPMPTQAGTWTLVVEKSPTLPAGRAFGFPLGARALAGRSSEMDIQLDDTFVSAKHALFEATPGGLQVEDLLSTNGTQLNGTDIADAQVLREGDRVEVGDTLFRVEVR